MGRMTSTVSRIRPVREFIVSDDVLKLITLIVNIAARLFLRELCNENRSIEFQKIFALIFYPIE